MLVLPTWYHRYVGDFFVARDVGDKICTFRDLSHAIVNPSYRHQNLKIFTDILSPTSVTDIDVANLKNR